MKPTGYSTWPDIDRLVRGKNRNINVIFGADTSFYAGIRYRAPCLKNIYKIEDSVSDVVSFNMRDPIQASVVHHFFREESIFNIIYYKPLYEFKS